MPSQATKEVIEAVGRFYAEDVAAFRKKVGEGDLKLLAEVPPL